MLSLVLATFFSANFGIIVRWAQGRRSNLWAVGAINYVCATLFQLARAAAAGPGALSPATVLIGTGGGVAYVTAFGFLCAGMAKRGVSIATAILRLSVLLPIVVAIVFWGEEPQGWQAAGATLALVSLPLLAYRPPSPGDAIDRRTVVQLVVLFILNGFCMLAVRGYQQTGIRGQESLFLAFLFGTAAIGATGAWVWQRVRAHSSTAVRRDLIPGVLLGLCNAVANLTLVQALQSLSSVIVFPFQSAVGLIYVALFARIAWREQIRRSEAAGMAVALIAVALINLA